MIQTYTVYADVLFFLNLFMDFFLLWATGRFLRLTANYPRLLLAAFIGALYGVGFIFPGLEVLYTMIIKVAFSFLLLRIAFAFQGWRPFLQSVGVFYLIAFAMAGAVLGGSSLLEGANVDIAGTQIVRGGSLIFALIIAVVLARKGFLWLKRNWQKKDFQVNIEIFLQGRQTLLTALIDTGNALVDPISTSPVIVAEYQALESLFPQKLRQLYQQYGGDDPTKILQEISLDDYSLSKRLRLIPFTSIGKKHGLLLGFMPDKTVIYHHKKSETEQVIVALHDQNLGKGENYQAVINPAVLDVARPLYSKKPKKESLV